MSNKIFIATETSVRPRHQSGHITIKGSKQRYYYGEYNTYVQDADGKSVRKHRGVHLGYVSQITKSAALEKLQKIIYQETGQGVSATDKVTLTWFWSERFLVARHGGWSDATLKGNVSDWSHYLAPGLGHLKLSEVEPFIMQKHFNHLAADGYAKSIVQKSKTLLSSILSYAVDLKFLPANPMISASGKHAVKMPKFKRREKPTVDADEMAQLFALITDQRDKLILTLAYHYGLSAEEVFGLCWNDIDQHHLHIRNTAWHGVLYRDNTKREARRRDLPLHPELRDMIEDWKQHSEGEEKALLFPGKDGKSPMWPNVWLHKHIMPAARRCGIENVTFQIMRRSFATDNLARDPKATQHIMGHEKPDMTAHVYAQPQESKIIELLDNRWQHLGLSPTKSVQ